MKVFLRENYDDPFYITPLLRQVRSHDLPIHLERDHWTFVSSIMDADVIPLVNNGNEPPYTFLDHVNYLGKLNKNQYLLLMFHTHASEHFNTKQKDEVVEKYKVITNNIITVDINAFGPSVNKQHIYNNFIFNFIKAIFTEYEKHDFSHPRMWIGYTTKESFTLQEISSFKLNKRFLIPNIMRPHNREYKEIVRKTISEQIIKDDDCFYSDHDKDIVIKPKETSVEFLSNYNFRGGQLHPFADFYYNESIISVFSETIGTGQYGVHVITEKTYIPLIRGHFIMPFSYKGIINDLKNFGFKFPNWIDYSYDNIDNDTERLEAFVASVLKLRQISLEDLASLANNDLDILKYNRNLFYDKPYDYLYPKIKLAIEYHKRVNT